MKPEVDPKRSGVKAALIEWTEPPCELIADRWYAPPGSMVPCNNGHGMGHLIACPGCGKISSPKDGAMWQVAGGSLDDVTTLSLSPSILNGCCGWHGYLTNGVFHSC